MSLKLVMVASLPNSRYDLSDEVLLLFEIDRSVSASRGRKPSAIDVCRVDRDPEGMDVIEMLSEDAGGGTER